jgi:hypothetical protein
MPYLRALSGFTLATLSRKRKQRKAEAREETSERKGHLWPLLAGDVQAWRVESSRLARCLESNDEQQGEQAVKEALRVQFAVDSLTFISPPEFEAFCDDGNHPISLASLITMSRKAEAEAQANG